MAFLPSYFHTKEHLKEKNLLQDALLSNSVFFNLLSS
ncbi:hypothetical protein BACCIP111895_00001 [Neobacillus rhizosphaerae]|uniref:Uncharacterized protein n=1 Tax=Neobacillus rhizosphaerae TaxID=2880965 RepID=A0ABM9EJV9_9BACI|nr:hypothetical protein BACCIP111895_00001 [Neobacillus rhizosphaerae]